MFLGDGAGPHSTRSQTYGTTLKHLIIQHSYYEVLFILPSDNVSYMFQSDMNRLFSNAAAPGSLSSVTLNQQISHFPFLKALFKTFISFHLTSEAHDNVCTKRTVKALAC